MEYVSRIVSVRYWQPYRLAPKMSWPPLASPPKKASAATDDAGMSRQMTETLLTGSETNGVVSSFYELWIAACNNWNNSVNIPLSRVTL